MTKLLLILTLALGIQTQQMQTLLDQAERAVSKQNFELALQKALEALDMAGNDPYMQVQALKTVVGVDIMASRDADAWEKALEAEEIARRKLSPAVKRKLRCKVIAEAAADLLLPAPVQLGYHVYQLVTLKDL